ncbi:MAG: PAS domain-containing protein, partial [Acidobacteriota bacterium]
REKNFVDSNQAGLDLLGYSREELLRMAISDVDADPDAVIPAQNQLLGGGRINNYEHQLIHKNGNIVTVLNNSQPLIGTDGKVIGIQSILGGFLDLRVRGQTQIIIGSEHDHFLPIHANNRVLTGPNRPEIGIESTDPKVFYDLEIMAFLENIHIDLPHRFSEGRWLNTMISRIGIPQRVLISAAGYSSIGNSSLNRPRSRMGIVSRIAWGEKGCHSSHPAFRYHCQVIRAP